MNASKNFYRVGKAGRAPLYMVAAVNLNEALEKAKKVLKTDSVYARRMYRAEESDTWLL